MSKNDQKKMQNMVNTQVKTAQTSQDDMVKNHLNPASDDARGYYNSATPMQMDDYRSIMDQYKNYASGAPQFQPIGNERVNYNRSPEMQKAMTGYGGFADNGGFSEDDLSNIRARGISPIRSVYSNAQNEMARQKNLQGGYSPNYGAVMSKMRSGTSQQIADNVQNVNANIAQMVQSGKLSGLSGLSSLANADTGYEQEAQYHNQDAGLRAGMFNAQGRMYDPRLAAIEGQASMFGATPGMSKLFGDQMMGANSQLLNANQLQQGIGQMGINGQFQTAQIPGNFDQALGRVGKVGQMVGQIAAPFFGAPQTAMATKTPNYMGNAMSSGPISQAYNPVGQISYPRGMRLG